MFKYTVRRLLQMIPVFLGATFLIYWMVFSLPGDPTAGKCGDRPCPEAYVAQFEEKYNLNDPLLVQYGKYMAGVLQGDFGESHYGVPVSEELAERFAVTAKLGLMALGIEAVIGILAGVLAGLKKGGFLDNLVLVSTLAVISLPDLRHRLGAAALPRHQARLVPGDGRRRRVVLRAAAARLRAGIHLAGLPGAADAHQPVGERAAPTTCAPRAPRGSGSPAWWGSTRCATR